jgi:hypothetical protein
VQILDAILPAVSDDPPHRELPGIVDGGIGPARRLEIYANNAAANFLETLQLEFPVIRRLVGDAYFGQCARDYRRGHPSRSGDLQRVGAAFPDYWRGRHGADRYRYLADVARLEWLIQESLTAADDAPFDLGRLGRVAPRDYDGLRFRLHAASRRFASPFPVRAIWAANQVADLDPPVIDLDTGGDRLLIVRSSGGFEFLPLSEGEWGFAAAIDQGADFSTAVTTAARSDGEFDATAALQKLVLGGAIVDFSTARERGPGNLGYVVISKSLRTAPGDQE